MTPDIWSDFLSKVASIVVGSIPGVGMVLLFVWRLTRRLDTFLIEHEMLMGDYVKNRGITLRDLPTRSRKI